MRSSASCYTILCVSFSGSLVFSSFFFFYSSAHPLHLHSFPTRRSSDLRRAVTHAFGEGHDVRRHVPVLDAAPLERDAGHQDRKSTRLNSSHLGISYAVFCLKKKNNRKRILNLITLTQHAVNKYTQ